MAFFEEFDKKPAFGIIYLLFKNSIIKVFGEPCYGR
jgi:hypothetical protein